MLLAKILSPFFLMAMRILSVIVYAVTILAAFSGNINPDYLTLPAILCLGFPYLAILTILLTVFWALNKKIIFCAFGVVTVVICLTPLSVVFPLGHSKSPQRQDNTFKIISWNVIHTRDLRKPDYKGNRAMEFIINSGADIVCFAELKNFTSELHDLTDSQKDSLLAIYPYREGLSTNDIKIMSKFPVERIEKVMHDEGGVCRFDFFKVSFPNSREVIVGMVHLFSFGLTEEERRVVTEIKSVETAKTSMKEFKGPIRDKMRNAFRKRAANATILRGAIDEISPKIPLIVCGDFNDVPTSWTYNLVRGDDMRDAYVETNFGPAVTYNLHAFYFHIDQMLYRGPIEALDLSVGKINTSDHYPLIGEFEFTD